MRLACGWGAGPLPSLPCISVRIWCDPAHSPTSPAYPHLCGADLVPLYLKRTLELENMYMFLFYLPSSAPSEPPTPVAMGALETVDVMYGDLALADPNPAVRRVLISRLFVYKWYEGGGVGGEVMDFLEAEARRRGAKTLTINCPPFEEDGTEGRLKEWCESSYCIP